MESKDLGILSVFKFTFIHLYISRLSHAIQPLFPIGFSPLFRRFSTLCVYLFAEQLSTSEQVN